VNRQTKRMMKRQESLAGGTGERRRPAAPAPNRDRTSPGDYLQEVKGELRKVAWPTKPEVVNSTLIVLVAVIIMTSLIFGFDWAFSHLVFWLYE
jgi:preprotein translocase subunit SecE